MPDPSPAPPAGIPVRQFREILVWPVQLMPLRRGSQIQNHWEQLAGPGCPWREVADEFTQSLPRRPRPSEQGGSGPCVASY
jgi:hypothetical protein